MSPVFASRRRAEEFASLVDATPYAPSDARTAHADLLELVAALRDAPVPEARSSFVADLRTELVSAADTVLAPAARTAAGAPERLTLPPAQRRRDRRVAALVGSLALVGATTSVAIASQGALPGQALYPVKRAIEDVRTDLRPADGDRGRLMLAHASERLTEVSSLSADADDTADAAAVAATLGDFGDQARQASTVLLADYAQHGHRGSVASLRDFDAASLRELAVLEAVVPAAARDEVLAAARVVLDIDAAAQQACPGCGGAGIHEIPDVLAGVASGTAPVVVPSATLHPETRPQSPVPPRGTATAGPDGAKVRDAATAGAGTGHAATDDPLGSLTGTLSGTVSGTLSGAAPLPTATPSPTGVAGLLQQTGDAVQDATKDAGGSGLTDGSTDGALPDLKGTVDGVLP